MHFNICRKVFFLWDTIGIFVCIKAKSHLATLDSKPPVSLRSFDVETPNSSPVYLFKLLHRCINSNPNLCQKNNVVQALTLSLLPVPQNAIQGKGNKGYTIAF